MSGWIFTAAVAFLVAPVTTGWQRREHRNAELAELGRAKRAAYFWGDGIEAANKAFKDKVVEHDSWRNNIGYWAILALGVVLLVIAGLFWFGEEPTHTWGQLWGHLKDTGFLAPPLPLDWRLF